jgi:hypothetical protein
MNPFCLYFTVICKREFEFNFLLIFPFFPLFNISLHRCYWPIGVGGGVSKLRVRRKGKVKSDVHICYLALAADLAAQVASPLGTAACCSVAYTKNY